MTCPRLRRLGARGLATCVLATSSAVIACGSGREPADSSRAAPSAGSWLSGSTEDRLAQVERHLRGLDVAMAEIGYRYGELVTAAARRRWTYAQYQAQKIELALRLAVERRPARGASARPFLDSALPAVLDAIQRADTVALDFAVGRLGTACAACHAAENAVHFNEVVERIWQRSR